MAAGNGRPLKVGVQLPETERAVRWSELRQMARRAEAIGFDSLWVGDHLLYRFPGEEPRGPWEAWSLLAALAAVTERVELGPLVACGSFRNPALLAKMAETVDEISGGRLILGLGAGWHEPEYRAFGYPFDHLASRFAEAFAIIRDLLRSGRADFEGTYHAARDGELRPRGPRPGRIPLMIGSFGDRMLRLTLPHVDLWNAWYADYGNTVEGLRRLMAKVDAVCAEVGRDPATVGRTAAVLVSWPGGRGRPVDSAERTIPPLRGSPSELAEALRAFAEIGVSHLQLVLDPITLEAIEACGVVLEELDRARP